MKAKQAEKNIRRKIAAWLSTIPDDELRKEAAQNVIVTGGCIVSLLLDERVNDYDLYFKDPEVALAIAQHYIVRFVEASEASLAAKREQESKTEKTPMSFPNSIEFLMEYMGESATGGGGFKAYNEEKDGEEDEEYEEGKEQSLPETYAPDVGPNFEITAGIRHDKQGVSITIPSAGVASVTASSNGYKYFEQAKNDQQTEEYVGEVFERMGETKANLEKDRSNSYQPIFITSNAITLSDGVQLVFRFCGSPREIHANYDFVHCTNYWTVKNGLTLRKPALAAILGRELVYVGSKYPVCSLLRVRKFIKRGWHITAGQMLKIILQVNDFDLTDPVVLKDQLVGVDFAYFSEMLDKLKSADPSKIDRAYLIEIIDGMDGEA